MDVQTFIDAVSRAGPLALFLVMTYIWWLERDERIKSQERERSLTRELLETTVKSTNAIRALRYVLLHGRAPKPEEYEAEDVG